MSARNKRQLIGGLIGASIGLAAYALAFRNDGDGTIGLLFSASLFFGGFPGFLVGALIGTLVGSLADLWSGRHPLPPETPVRWPQNKFAWITATFGAGFMPVLFLVNSLTNGPPMRPPGDLIGVIFFGAVGGLIGGAFGNHWCGRRGR